jgi:hypothetical protein
MMALFIKMHQGKKTGRRFRAGPIFFHPAAP